MESSNQVWDKILIVQPDVSPEALQAYVETGALPDGAYEEDIHAWMARGRVPDCDCELMQCVCAEARGHAKSCAYRLSISCPFDLGILACDCSTG
jgi:hypothetical protein